MENCRVTVAFSYLVTDLLDQPFFLEVLNNSFCNIVTVFMDKRIERQFQGFHSVLTFPNHSKSKAKIKSQNHSIFSPINEEMPILKLIMHFGLCHARALLFFVFFCFCCCLFNSDWHKQLFKLDLYYDDVFLEYQHPTPLTVILYS